MDYLVQIEVRRSEAGRSPRGPVRLLLPAPGDALYVHLYQRPGGGRGFAAEGYKAVPSERSVVRALPDPAAPGGRLEGTYPDWFDLASDIRPRESVRPGTPGRRPRAARRPDTLARSGGSRGRDHRWRPSVSPPTP